MSSQSRYISLTVRLENDLYRRFHEAVSENGHSHVAVVRILIEKWLVEKKMADKYLAVEKKR